MLKHLLILVALLCIVGNTSDGQNIVRIPPYTQNSLYLNDQIVGDTLPNGQRRDPNAVYVLTRGGLYLSNNIIRNIGWTVRIRANDSTTTRRPVVQLYPNPTTGLPPGQFVDARGHVWIRNLIISGCYESAPVDTFWHGLQGALFNVSAAGGFNIEIDSCILTNTNGNHIRSDQSPGVLRITNNIFANMGYLGRSNLGAGKAIDVRAGSVDSLIVINNTFVNWQDRIIRHFQSTANIKYLRFDHNTLVNGMSYHGLLSLGRMGSRAYIRNNLLVDAFALGRDTDAVRQAEFTDSGELDPFGFPRMTWIFSNPNDSTVWSIKNNYYTVSAAGQAFYDSASILPIIANPPLTVGTPLTYHINSRIGSDSLTAFRNQAVTLNNIPRLMVEMMKWYRRPSASGGAGKTKATSNFTVPPTGPAPFDYDRRRYIYYRDTLDCKYPTTSPLYTAALGGYPVGDLNWWPARKAAWLIDPVSGVAPGAGTEPEAFTLEQNYPNPFNPSTRIAFTLTKAGFATLTVYNILGQKVATLIHQQMPAGEHEVDFDASQLSTGVYFYRLEAGNNAAVRKMMVLK